VKIFVAGASGAIGRPLVRQLVRAGHDVVGLTRSADRAEWIRADGAEAVVGDVFDADRLISLVREAQPEVVVHELTSIPRVLNVKRYAEEFAPNNRVRIEGTRNLVAAAHAAGAQRMVAESVAFVYAPTGGDLASEDDPLYLDAPGSFAATVEAVRSLEAQVLDAQGLEGLVLRYGYFYGPGTAYAPDGQIGGAARRRRLPVIGGGAGVWSFIHVEDAASATTAALSSGTPGVYNVVDDDPAPAAAWVPAFCAAVGAPAPRRTPAFLAKRVVGEYVVYSMTRQRGATNAKARRELSWAPGTASWRTGFPATA
jgi:nucleoside-diphosphate-sugar epimerase